MDTVQKLADTEEPDAVYPANEAFWQDCTRRLAIYFQSRKLTPSKWELLKDSVLETLAEVPEQVGRASQAAAGAAANVVKEPAKLGLALLGAAILLPPIMRAVRK